MSIAASYLTQTVTWEQVTDTDEWGKPTVTTQSVSARVEPANRLVRTREGAEIISRAKVLLRATVQPGDWLTLPDGSRQQVLDVRALPGLGGEEFREVFL